MYEINKIRITFLIGQLAFGGSERQLTLLLSYLDPAVFECSVIVFNASPNSLKDELAKMGVQVITVPEKTRGKLQRILFLSKWVRRLSPHIVHSWTVHDNPYAGLVGRLMGVPVCWGSVRGSILAKDFQQLPWIYQWLSLKSVSRLVLNSQSIIDEVISKGVAEGNVLFLPNCVDLKISQDSIDFKEFGISNQAIVIGNVGNLKPVKNQKMFIDVMARVIKKFPDVRGVIVGEPSPSEVEWYKELERHIDHINLNGNVILTGFQSNTFAWMNRFTMLCSTSYSEGTPNVILEAMAASKPVVATKVGGVPALVQDGINGFLVEPDDVIEFSSAVIRLLEGQDLALKMGKAGREIVERKYNPDKVIRNLSGAYLQALNHKGFRIVLDGERQI